MEPNMEVFLLPYGNHKRGWDGAPVRGVVTSVKRTYVYVRVGGSTYRFRYKDGERLDADAVNQNQGYELFESLEKANRELTRRDQVGQIAAFVRSGNLSRMDADQVSAVHKILFDALEVMEHD